MSIRVFTIGFTKTTAEHFFSRLKSSHVAGLIDIRLNNSSQLAGFAKAADLKYFLKVTGPIEYRHEPNLAPTQNILREYRKNKGSWEDYEVKFLTLMKQRRIETLYSPRDFADSCLLCSEDTPDQCHRRLVLDYLKTYWPEMEIVHL